MEWWLYLIIAVAAILVGLVAVVLCRTLAFKVVNEKLPEKEEIEFDKEKAVKDLRAMLMLRTVSYRNKADEDESEFVKFEQLLFKLFPETARRCTFEKLGPRSLLFKWAGKSDANPTVLMSHYDVVPVAEADWKRPPFGGDIVDGELWGRGALDTKGTLNGAMQAVETLIKAGFVPENDIYLAFAGDEEISGNGAVTIVDEFIKRGVKPALVVDEGGAVVEGVFPGVKKPCALIGIAEKGMTDLRFSAKSNGGHASAPPPHTTVGKLSAACVRMENNPPRFTLSAPVRKMFDTLGRHSTFVYRMIFANLWLFGFVLDKMGKSKGGEMNALTRTTCAFTQMQGSKASNVLANEASLVANFRIIPGDTVDKLIKRAKKTVNDDSVEIEPIMAVNPSVVSTTDCDGYKKVKAAALQTWDGCIAAPYLMVACSDSRHYGKLTDKVFRFSAMALSSEERASIHANDERVPLSTIEKTVEFYLRLVKSC